MFYNKNILIQNKPLERTKHFICFENINKTVDIVNIEEANFKSLQNLNDEIRNSINTLCYNQQFPLNGNQK